MKTKVFMLLLCCTVALAGCGSSKPAAEEPAEEVVEAPVEEAPAEEEAQEEAPEETVEEKVEEKNDPNVLADDNPLKGIADVETMRTVYEEIDELMNQSYMEGPLSTETDPEKVEALEDELINQVAEAHGLTYDNVRDIYLNGGLGALYNFDLENIKLDHGDFLEAHINGTSIIIKAKIQPNLTNDMTIKQNYYNVCSFIREYGNIFHEVQYWAVADMTDGSEGKVIQFDVPRDVIDTIATGDFPDNQLGNYVENLWILPSLLN